MLLILVREGRELGKAEHPDPLHEEPVPVGRHRFGAEISLVRDGGLELRQPEHVGVGRSLTRCVRAGLG